MNRYNRSEFVPSTSVNGIEERDLLMNKFREYTFTRPFTNYRLQYEDYMRPDLISLKIYGTQDYWWIILRCNPKIEDIWNDFVAGGDSIEVSASQIDPSIKDDFKVIVDKSEYLYPDSYKVGELINIPSILDIQELYTFSKLK